MDGQRETDKTERERERKKDECSYNWRQPRAVSKEILGVAVIKDHLSKSLCGSSDILPKNGRTMLQRR